MKNSKPVLVMLVGLPGSGKSTYAKHLVSKGHVNVVRSSDELREELLSDINNQKYNKEIFNVLESLIISDLYSRNSVVYDATNLNKSRRIAF